jgi:hypothetical protein
MILVPKAIWAQFYIDANCASLSFEHSYALILIDFFHSNRLLISSPTVNSTLSCIFEMFFKDCLFNKRFLFYTVKWSKLNMYQPIFRRTP